MMLKKDALMAQNLKLLGFVSAPAGATGGGFGSSATNVQATNELHPNMFDRPNEKVLFRVLHFLLLKLKPHAAQVRSCLQSSEQLSYMDTVCIAYLSDAVSVVHLLEYAGISLLLADHDPPGQDELQESCSDVGTENNMVTVLLCVRKAILHELEKQEQLPIGSSQASRINTGCGPRVVDLIWRLSTLVIKESLRDSTASNFIPVSKLEGISTADALTAIKAKIAMKTHSLKEKSIERSHVQDEWVAFASTLTEKIQEIAVLQQRVYEDQNRLDTTINRDLYSHMRESQRSTKIQNLEVAWTCIEDVLKNPVYVRIQSVLDTAVQYNDEQPVLAAENLQPNQATRAQRGNVDLSDVVKSTETLIRMVRDRVERGGVNEIGETQDISRPEISSQHTTVLSSLVLKMQQLLSQMKDANELQMRDQYIRMATATAGNVPGSATKLSASSYQLRLCPLTPSQLLEQENHLVQSLKKVSMKELTALAAESVRRFNQKKEKELLSSGEAESHSSSRSVDENEVHRKLDYEDGG